MTERCHGSGWELLRGRWQDALADVGEVDTLICDPPYSERTHAGHDNGVKAADTYKVGKSKRTGRQTIGYSSWSDADAREFVASWSPRVRGWMCIQTDHVLARSFEAALDDAGRYVFPPLPIVEIGSRVRLTGDGPSSWSHWLVVARPRSREFQQWGTLRGAYVYSEKGDKMHMGGKPLVMMRDIVRDYTRHGDLVVDPCAGAGTTLLAAVTDGRRAIGAEMDPDTYAKARARLLAGHTPPLFGAEDHR